jgi:hypothetical protein
MGAGAVSEDDDLIPALLSPAEHNPPPERLEQLGLTADARRMRAAGGSHEIVIRFGRPFDIHTSWGAFLADVREITVPFGDRESAEGAQREITVSVRPVHDAGAEDYRPVVPGEVIRPAAEIESGTGRDS